MAGIGEPAALTLHRVVACIGLILFGAVVGVVAALSQASGTATMLLGLLFALLGGSLVSLFANANLSERDRCMLGGAVGFISLGMLLGMGIGFGLKLWEQGPQTAQKDSNKTDQNKKDRQQVFVVHSADQEKISQLKKACGSVLENLPKNDPYYSKFEKLYAYLEYRESLDSNLANIDEVLKSSADKDKYDRGGFKSKFEEFRKPETQPKP